MKTRIRFEGESAEVCLIHFLRGYQPIRSEEIDVYVEMKCKKQFCNTHYEVHLNKLQVESFSERVQNGNYDIGLESLCHDCDTKAEKFAEEAITVL